MLAIKGCNLHSDAIVVGAGVAGLFCATLLAKEGVRVTVLEAAAHCGGRARSEVDSVTGMQADIGPHVVSNEHRNFMKMLHRLGTADRIEWQRDPMITLLDRGRALHMPSVPLMPPLQGLPSLPTALHGLSPLDLASHWRVAWAGARSDETSLRQLDHEDAAGWLRRMGVRRRAIDWFWRATILSLLNVRLEHCSAASALRIFRLMMGRSGYHFGFPKVGLSQLYVPGCVREIEDAAGRVLTNHGVESLLVEHGSVAGVRLQGGAEMRSQAVVLAVPPQALVRIAHTHAPLAGLARRARLFEPSPYISSMLWFDRPLRTERFWARVWNANDLNTDFYELALIRPELRGGPSVVTCNAIGPLARLGWTDEQLIEKTVAEIAELAPEARRAVVRHARVHRVPMGIAQPRPGTETARPRNETLLPALWIAGDWTDTAIPFSMESAARSAALAAEGVLRARGRSVSVAIDAPETYGLVGLLRKRGLRSAA